MEYKFDEEVVDGIFGEAEMTVEEARERGIKGLAPKKATEIVNVQYPKVLVTKKAVKFLDKDNQIEKEIKYESKFGDQRFVIVSKKLVGVYKYKDIIDEGVYKGTSNTFLRVYDTLGNVKFSKDFYGGKDVYFTEGGSILMFDSSEGGGGYEILLLRDNGDLIKEIQPSESGYIDCVWDSSNDKIVIYTVSEEGAGSSPKPQMFLIDEKLGDIIWTKEINLKREVTVQIPIKIVLGKDYIVLECSDSDQNYNPEFKLLSFDIKRNLLWEKEILLEKIALNEKRGYLYLCTEGSIICLELLSGRVVWQKYYSSFYKENLIKEFEDSQPIRVLPIDIEVAENGDKVVIVVGQTRGGHNAFHYESKVIIFDAEGQILGSSFYRDKTRTLKLEFKNKLLTLISDRGANTYEIK